MRFAGEHGDGRRLAGNNGRDIDAQPSYPASLPDPAVLGVTASSERGGLIGAANHGQRSVDLAAPGDMIMSTGPRSGYQLRAGTWMAAPFVAGALALLAAARPDLSQTQLGDALLASAKRTPALTGRLAAGKVVSASRSFRVVR
ncbi:hypothetical protein BH20ACT17_BH20ACT17_05870 [soil metagenome]